jgi:hypothetical protein
MKQVTCEPDYPGMEPCARGFAYADPLLFDFRSKDRVHALPRIRVSIFRLIYALDEGCRTGRVLLAPDELPLIPHP